MFNLPEGLQRARPAAEVDPEQAEGAEATDGARQEVLQRIPRPAPSPSDESAHQRGEGRRRWRELFWVKSQQFSLKCNFYISTNVVLDGPAAV